MWPKELRYRGHRKKLDKMKNIRDFHHIHSGKRTEIDSEQWTGEQNKKLKIEDCKYFGTTHNQRQCPAFWNMCS